MRAFLHAIDARLLGVATHVAHRIQRLTGVSSIRLAKWCFLVLLATQPLNIVVLFHPVFHHHKDILNAIMAIVVLAVGPQILRQLDEADARHGSSETRVLDPWLTIDPTWRGICAVWVAIGLPFILAGLRGYTLGDRLWDLSDAISGLGYIYFVSVIPLPPGKSQVRAWLEQLQASVSPAPAPQPIG